MKISVKNTGECRRTVKVDVPAEAVSFEREAVVGLYSKAASLPGFRKGHAPRPLVEKKYAREIIEETKDRVVSKFYHEAVEKEDLQVVALVDAEKPDLKESGTLSFSVTVDVRPDVKLPKYEGIPIKAEKTEVSEKEVDGTLESICRRYAEFEQVEGRAACEGDMVEVSYEASVDGQPLEEKIPEARGLGRGTGYWISCDDESFLPGMGKALIGAQVGDKKEVPVSFPDGFIVKELAGIKALYRIEVTAMREIKPPVMDEEFFKKLHVASEDELRSNIRKHLEESAQQRETARRENEICQYLLRKTRMDVSETDVNRQLRAVFQDLVRQRMAQGVAREQIEAQRDELMKEAKEKGEEQVKLRYLLMAVADAEQIQADDQEVSEEVVRMAIARRCDASDFRKQLEKEEQMDAVREQVRFNKTMAKLLELAKIK